MRGQTAYLRFAVRYTGDYDVAYFIDDVSLVAADVHTQAEPMPAALAGDGSRPLVLLQRNPANPDGLTVVRLDTDGTNPLAIDTGLLHEPRVPRWSPDGSTITVLDDDVSPHDVAVPAMLKARITRLSVMRPDGSGRREIFATQGLEGTSGSPPFCRPPQCVDTPRAALDQIIKGVDWSPDGRSPRGDDLRPQPLPLGRVRRRHVPRRDRRRGQRRGDPQRPRRLVPARLGRRGPHAVQRPGAAIRLQLRGVWEGDPSVTPATQELIVPAPVDLLVGGDRLPTWAPDGRHFVTARQIGGYRYDANGFA